MFPMDFEEVLWAIHGEEIKHTAPSFTIVCSDERHVCGYEKILVKGITTEPISV